MMTSFFFVGFCIGEVKLPFVAHMMIETELYRLR